MKNLTSSNFKIELGKPSYTWRRKERNKKGILIFTRGHNRPMRQIHDFAFKVAFDLSVLIQK